jgi:drug/metabolite transporter (DMT)-like permease
MTRQSATSQGDRMQRPTHILNAASNLLGIALLIIAGLNVSHIADKSFADEIAWVAALCFAASCLLSYLTLRHERRGEVTELWADRIFLAGLGTLIGSIIVLAIGNR